MTSEDKVLSAEESEALLAAGEPDGAPAGEPGAIRDVDPGQWEQVAVGRIPALDAINDDTAEAIDEIWARLCRKIVVTSPQGVERRPWRDYLREMQQPLSANLMEVRPDGGRGLIVLRPETVYAMVDLFFGGSAGESRESRLTQLTQMEARLGRRFAAELAQRMQEAWSHHFKIEITALDQAFDVDTTPVANPTDRVVVVAFEFEMGEARPSVEIVWPARLIDQLKVNEGAVGADKGKSRWSAKLSEDVQAARVDLRAVLGEVRVKLSDIANARPGDIFMSDSLTEVKLYAGDRAILEGTLGAHRGHNAVKVKSALSRKDFGELNG